MDSKPLISLLLIKMTFKNLKYRIYNLPYRIRRSIRHFWQRRTRGFDDSELWNLDDTFARWILPRLKAFRATTPSHPHYVSYEEWLQILDDMIYAFETYIDTEYLFETDERTERGMNYFIKYIGHLWI